MKNTHNPLPFLFLTILFICVQSCSTFTNESSTNGHTLKLNLLHLNDTHSYLDPSSLGWNMVFEGTNATAFLGGFTRLKTAIDEVRRTRDNVLLVHAGDAVQGTLYFTKFQGDADIELLNHIGVEVMTFGNHEFDKGLTVPKKFVENARFPIVSANIDFTKEPSIGEGVKPYVIKYYDNKPVAIIGVTTEDTTNISSPGPTIVFNNVAESLKKTIAELEAMGINKIIVLSHIGYERDKRIAEEVKGIDVIVGGHSHTLLGDDEYVSFGLDPEGPYPTVVNRVDGETVLIVQAWKWGQVLGLLSLEFDKDGKVIDYKGEQLIVVNDRFMQNRQVIPPESADYKKIVSSIKNSKGLKIFSEDPKTENLLTPLRSQLEQFYKQVLTVAEDNLVIGLNSGPGPLVIDSFVAKTGADIGIINREAIRTNLSKGNITVGNVYELLPFNDTLCLTDLTGKELKQVLEEGIDFQISRSPSNPGYPYVSGLVYEVQPHLTKGNRVSGLWKKRPDGSLQPIEMDKVYRLVTINFIALQAGDGFDFFRTFKGTVTDTGFVDAEVFSEYLSSQRSIKNPTEVRIRINNTGALKTDYIIFVFHKGLKKMGQHWRHIILG